MTRRRPHVVALLFLLACSRRATSPVDAGADAAPSGNAPRTLRIDPRLLDEGRIKVALVERRAAAGVIALPADVVSTAEGRAEAGSLLSGRVARFERREGDRVRQGEILAWIDAPEAARAVADVVRARSRVETQGRKAARLEGLVASEAATAAALDEARLDLEIARADLAAARTIVTSLGLPEPAPASGAAAPLGARLPVKSPVDGTIVERGVPLGGHVSPEAPLFRVVSTGRVLIDARIADGVRVPATDGSAQVTPRGGVPCKARVIGALPQVDPSTRSRRLRLAPEDACVGLVAGAQAEVEIEIPASAGEMLVVPARSIVERKAGRIVFVARPERGAFEPRPVEPGARIGEDVAITMGLEEGESIVVEGAVLLKGELIRAELGGEG